MYFNPRSLSTKASTLVVAAMSLFSACASEDDHNHDNENEVITTVKLTLTPQGGGAPLTFSFLDADGDGGNPPVIDPVVVPAGSYDLTVKFENALETPAEDLTLEVSDESQEHQLFFTGSAVNGPASMNVSAPLLHAYSDKDVNNLPIGLVNTITATAGSGQLVVTLRHLPPVSGTAAKTSDLAEKVKTSGFSAIGGSTDAQVTFAVTVN